MTSFLKIKIKLLFINYFKIILQISWCWKYILIQFSKSGTVHQYKVKSRPYTTFKKEVVGHSWNIRWIFFWFFKKEILFEVCINKANLGSFKINVMHFLPKKKIWFPQELSTTLKKIFFPIFKKSCMHYIYVYFFSIFSCSLWNEPTMKIYFLSHSHTWTPLLRVLFGHARVPFGHALGHQQSSILKICKSIMPFLKKIRNLTKNLPDIQNLTKTNKKSLQQQEQTFSRLITIPPQSN